jgi:fructokinase
MPTPTVIGLGELLWDVFPDSRRPGGAPANVAFHAGQLGLEGLVASRVGDDDDGRGLLEFLREKGLSTRLVQTDVQHPTGRVTVTLSAGQPSYVIHENVAWDCLQPEAALLEAVAAAGAVCFGTLAQRSPVSRETIHRGLAAAGATTLVVYDVNLRQRWYEREWIERSLRACDVVKLNHEELAVLSNLLGTGRRAEEFVATLCERYGVQTVCITRGAEGCILADAKEWHDVPGVPVAVVDTVGAGDAFTAALIVGLLNGDPPARIARFANRVGGLIASRAGAMPEWKGEVRRVKSEVGRGSE